MYFITTIDSKDDDMRCVGYFDTFQKAECVILCNIHDIWETCYDYAVIEYIPEGLYQYDFDPKWYKWNKDTNQYEQIEYKPNKYRREIGFAIG